MRISSLLSALLCSISLLGWPGLSAQGQVSFDWLLGNWKRTNDQAGQQTFEYWQNQSDTLYEGFGYTLQQGDTVWQEHIRLICEGTDWSFRVTGKGAPEPTVFLLTKIDSAGFSCENPRNEFPQQIHYQRKDKKILASIAGNGREVPFEFEKTETREEKR